MPLKQRKLPEFQVFAAQHLKQVCEHFLNLHKIEVTATQKIQQNNAYKFDLSDVKGQLRPRRALEISAAGGHFYFI